MDFNHATTRLKKDHDDLRSRANRRPQQLASNKATMEAKKRQEYRQRELQKKKEKERIERLTLDYIKRGLDIVEGKLGVVRNLGGDNGSSDGGGSIVGSSSISKSLILEATSIHGQGDKITLPSSLLGTLASRDLLVSSQERGQPLFFRLGIKRQGYEFPSSDKMKVIMNEYKEKITNNNNNNNNINNSNTKTDHDNVNNGDSIMEEDEDEDDDDQHETKQKEWEEAYMDELSQEYISYAYATVIEFTQDEGYIGLPKSIAHSLLSCSLVSTSNVMEIPTQISPLKSKYTVDPASVSSTFTATNDENIEDKNGNDVDNENDEETKTPGHPAYGSFAVPIDLIEVSLLTHLPLGRNVTLQPTKAAIENGFYNLKDIKVALEQSLIRTRGCLNIGDVLHCWHRGKQYDLSVKKLEPSWVGAVSCVNTDIEVDIAAIDHNENDDNKNIVSSSPSPTTTTTLGDGIRDGYTRSSMIQELVEEANNNGLAMEPPVEQKENIITIQVRGGDGGQHCRRRFDSSTSTMRDVFTFVVHEKMTEVDFILVSRFPRRVFHLEDTGEIPLGNMNFSSQEMLLIEKKLL